MQCRCFVVACGIRKSQWKGNCGAPLTEFSLIMLSHWCIVGFIIKRNLPLARWLMVIFGVLPFFASLYLAVISDWYATYAFVITGYLFVFGVLFPLYIGLSPSVKAYATYCKHHSR